MSTFLSEEEFNTLKSQHKQIKPWKVVPLNQIFYIKDLEKIQTKNGEASVITLIDDIGEEQRVYATSLLAQELVGYQGGMYIKSLGKKQSEKNKGHSYYHYELANVGYDTVY